MKERRSISKIVVIGCGVIGASWTAYFLARGFDVAATARSAETGDWLRAKVDSFWPSLARTGIVSGASKARLTFTTDLSAALAGADFVQENGPERVDIKRDLISKIDAAVDADVLIATSSSGIKVSDIQDAAGHPERVLVGHPFNPPHLIPLVEVVGGTLTSPEAIKRAMDFYTDIGKKPIHIRREMNGHVANRLQAALSREAFYLVEQEIVTAAELDTAITDGPGLRWALLGPFLTMHLAGGEGGAKHALDHFGPAVETWWSELGSISKISDAARTKTIEGVNEMLKTLDLSKLVEQRDDVLQGLLAMKAKADSLP